MFAFALGPSRAEKITESEFGAGNTFAAAVATYYRECSEMLVLLRNRGRKRCMRSKRLLRQQATADSSAVAFLPQKGALGNGSFGVIWCLSRLLALHGAFLKRMLTTGHCFPLASAPPQAKPSILLSELPIVGGAEMTISLSDNNSRTFTAP